MAKPRVLSTDDIHVYLTALQQHLNALRAEAERLQQSGSPKARHTAAFLREQVNVTSGALRHHRDQLTGLASSLRAARESDLSWRDTHPITHG